MILYPNAKINLGLNITERRPDGYHNLESLFIPVNWCDILEIVPASGSDCSLTVYGNVPACDPADNLVMKAYRALDTAAPGRLSPVDIYLEKIIPEGAGLGGGSSDAAFMLKGLNEMFDLGLDDDHLASIAATLGADCAFFIYNKPMIATGIGTNLSPLATPLPACHIIIVKPDLFISTREAYMGVKPGRWEISLAELLHQGNFAGLRNDFEASIGEKHPQINALKEQFIQSGAFYSSMSGSGSAVYGLYSDAETARKAMDILSSEGRTFCGVI